MAQNVNWYNLSEELIGIIDKDGYINLDDGRKFEMPKRGTDDEGYPEVLMDAKNVGGSGWMCRQSIKPFIGMKCSFILNDGTKCGFNFKIL